jgi:hypothetical protein
MTTIKARQEFISKFLPGYYGDARVAALEDIIVELEKLEEEGCVNTSQYDEAIKEMERLEGTLLLEALDMALESNRLAIL